MNHNRPMDSVASPVHVDVDKMGCCSSGDEMHGVHGDDVRVEKVVQSEKVSSAEGNLVEANGLGFSIPEACVFSGTKKKKRGCFRKKSRLDKSPSPSGVERPKKRARDGDGPFDIDRFIFNVQEGQTRLEETERSQEVLVPEDGVGDSLEDRECANQVGVDINKEVSQTVGLGNVLGATNMNGYEAPLRKMIGDEGFQSVSS
ncbi:hypothetical protein Hanom_Chr17g01569671 [Helianthus anomalus]